jgi:L-iditol 2-dehydrogenase
MIAAVFNGPEEIEVKEIETPKIGPGEVLVEVGANTVCGTDVRILRGEKTTGIYPPSILGHEFAGRVARVGGGVRGYEVGATVAMSPIIPCRGCFYCKHDMENVCANWKAMGYEIDGGLSEYVRVPADAVEAGCLFAVHEDLPFEQLALTEPLSCCVNGQRRSRVGLDDTVLVMGAGPIGLLHLQLALLAGARSVLVSEPDAPRRGFAEALGAHVAVDPTSEDLSEVVAESTGGLGADAVIICIGMPELVNEAFELARLGGRVNVFAGLADEGWAEVAANLIHYKEIEVTGQTGARRSDYEVALRLIESGRVKVGEMVTHRFPLQDTAAALDAAAGGDGIKVAVMPGANKKGSE